jgi:hypothetical protein
MSLPKPDSSYTYLIAIVFLIMGIISGSSGTLIAAGVWFVIGFLFSDRE